MARWLACLLPWMVTTVALAAPTAVKVQYTYHGSDFPALKQNEDVFITPTEAKKWGWNITLKGNEYQFSCEGRNFRLPIQTLQNTKVFRLNDAAQYVGANTKFENGTFKVLSSVRSIDVTKDGLEVSSTIQTKTKVYRVSNPDRLVIDVQGAEVEDRLISGLPTWWRYAQYAPDIVRVVLEHPATPLAAVPGPQVTRFFQLNLPDLCLKDPSQINAADIPKVYQKPTDPAKTVNVGKPTVLRDSETETVLQIPLSKNLPTSPSMRYQGASRLELRIPNGLPGDYGTQTLSGSRWLSSYMVSGDAANATITLDTKAPMAFSVSTQGSNIIVKLFRPAISNSGLNGKVIVIDPGHGGKDGGANAGGVMEKVMALKVSKEIVSQLTAAGASVITTRDEDTYPSLSDRAILANDSNADIFISVHFNSNSKADSRSGTITFHHKTSAVGQLLAECIHEEIAKVNNLPDIGVWSDGKIYQSGFKVLRDTKMPGVLLELAFVNHRTDRAEITKKDFPERIAKAVVKGVSKFLGVQGNE